MICTSRLIPFCESLSLATGFLRYLQNMDFYRTHPLTFVQTEKVIQWENLPILKFILCIITVSKKPMKMATSHVTNEFR